MKHYINATIKQNKQLTKSYFQMILDCAEIAKEALPGQFITIDCGGDTFLKRPMGLSYADKHKGEIGFIYQVVGQGTKSLKEKSAGEKAEIIGPLGNHFWVESSVQSIVLVGGGTGIGPLIICAKWLHNSFPACAVHTFVGARSADILYGDEELKQYSKKIFVTTDDGTKGEKGFVTDALAKFLKQTRVDQIITCGPTPMMYKVAQMGEQYNIPVQASLEEYMACGFGACLGCACEIKDEGYKMVCIDGTVFDTKKIIWRL